MGLHRLRRLRGELGGDTRPHPARPAGGLDRDAQRGRARDPQRRRDHARPPAIRSRSSPGADSTPVTTAVVAVVRLVVDEAVRRRDAGGLPRCGIAAQAVTARAIYSVARDGVLPGVAVPPPGRPPAGPDRRDRRDDGHRLPRAPPRTSRGRDRHADQLRHGRDLRRRSCSSRSPPSSRACAGHGSRRVTSRSGAPASCSTSSPSRGSRSRRSTSPGRGIDRAAGRALVPGVGRSAGARAHPGGRGPLPARRTTAGADAGKRLRAKPLMRSA